MKPIIPFEPIAAAEIPLSGDWVFQVKWDGVRILVYKSISGTEVINRHLNNRTIQYPELLDTESYSKADSFILDGEVIALVDGKPSFHEVMKRDRLRGGAEIEIKKKEIPIIYMVFDCLYMNGVSMMDKPLYERQKMLRSIVKETEHIRLTENFEEGEGLLHAVKEQGLEGILCKDLHACYLPGGKDARWQKIKNYQDVIAVVCGYIQKGSGLRSLLLGLYDSDGQLHYIGKAGRGRYNAQDWKTIQHYLEKSKQAFSPFVKAIHEAKDCQWVSPIFTVKVQFLEWSESRTLRQPVLDSFVERNPLDCRFEKEGSQ
ncbi:hypothetical protein AC622_13920 [Bacillus sp. FJAT-27916]|uniref:ATP-dependent DNA ligase n=1 Tax=Bacillaceae TaxID=186817 RepID=UPI000670F223|nr:hypothetical protein [Bacillus sp. FJAT-27916]KMY45189.1 hypothetical protein AC622_13920 [Bacillus sp. FJAT-27916]